MSKKKPLVVRKVNRVAKVSHDDHYSAPTTNTRFKQISVQLSDPNVHSQLKAIVKSGLASSIGDAVAQATQLYIKSLSSDERKRVKTYTEAYNMVQNL